MHGGSICCSSVLEKLSSSGRLLGVGNTLTDTQGEVEIPLSLVFQGTVLSVRAVITSLPAGVKLMVGLPLMHEIRALPDVVNCRVYCRGIHEVIRLDALRNILKRLESPPISVLSFFGGLEVALPVLLELGFQIGYYYSVEPDPTVRSVVESWFPDIVYLAERIENLTESWLQQVMQWVIAVFAGPPCIHWSSLRDSPGGFGEDDSILFKICGEWIRWIIKNYPDVNIMVETVVPHKDLWSQMHEQDDCTKGHYQI